MNQYHTYRAIDRLKRRALKHWMALSKFGQTHEEENARLEYVALVDLSNAWTR